jgi:hypothetical protein
VAVKNYKDRATTKGGNGKAKNGENGIAANWLNCGRIGVPARKLLSCLRANCGMPFTCHINTPMPEKSTRWTVLYESAMFLPHSWHRATYRNPLSYAFWVFKQ